MERIWVPIVGTVAVLAFVAVELTGSGADEHISQTAGTALAMVLFTILGSVGVGFTRLQPRLALLGVATAMLSLLSFGAFVVAIWNQGVFGFGFGFSGAGAKVAWITLLLTFATAAACALLATVRPEDEGGVRVTRFAGAAALATFMGLGVLEIAAPSTDIGNRIYAYLATVYVVATALLLLVRLLPRREPNQPAHPLA
jgi:hypothetical protein